VVQETRQAQVQAKGITVELRGNILVLAAVAQAVLVKPVPAVAQIAKAVWGLHHQFLAQASHTLAAVAVLALLAAQVVVVMGLTMVGQTQRARALQTLVAGAGAAETQPLLVRVAVLVLSSCPYQQQNTQAQPQVLRRSQQAGQTPF
jgi:hypothetical protein